ncbi:S1 family peptidase [Actinomycetospora chiangmaiensis]|uniref:S1 family peptidase n=1 Tax=Actinomycetospora chiangmaiensis TaxID=402650 RepID=UPI0012F8559A|nr:serine protease [Actinomycetospora chiangmaiensis]
MITAEVWQCVLQVQGEDAFTKGNGTGTLLRLDGRQVLITADHLTTGEPEEYFNFRAPFITGSGWSYKPLVRLSQPLPGVDIAVFDFPEDHGALLNDSLPLGMDDAGFSQDVFLLGHPYGLSLQLGSEADRFELPLVKKGILAGQKFEHDVKSVFVDCIANPGFSGGPAVFQVTGSNRWKFLGVIKGQYVQDPPEGDIEGLARTPAGITHVTEISSGLRRLREVRDF